MGYYSAKLMALLIKLVYPTWSDNNVAGSDYMTALMNDFTKTFSQTTATFGSAGADTSKWMGGVLAPNGKIYGIPYGFTTVLEIGESQTIDTDAVLSRYLNKF